MIHGREKEERERGEEEETEGRRKEGGKEGEKGRREGGERREMGGGGVRIVPLFSVAPIFLRTPEVYGVRGHKQKMQLNFSTVYSLIFVDTKQINKYNLKVIIFCSTDD